MVVSTFRLVDDDPTIVAGGKPGAPLSRVLAPGTVFGDYEIASLIGRGGMGVVYEVRHTHLGRRLALKVLPPEFSGDTSFRERFRREAQVLASLEHRHIVPVQHAGEVNGCFFLAMDLLPTSLARLLGSDHNRAHRPGTARIEAITRQILEALVFAHGRGIVHRDLKPANILLDASGEVRLADFGVAKVLGQEFMRTLVERTLSHALAAEAPTRTARQNSGESIVGTLDYMAPEVRVGRDADGRADLFAVGVIAYEMLTGRKPIGRFRDPSTLVPGLDPRWDELINRALEPEPADRWPNARTMLEALPSIRTTEAPAAPPKMPEPIEDSHDPANLVTQPHPSPEGTVGEAPEPVGPVVSQEAARPVEGKPWTIPDLELNMAWIPAGDVLLGASDDGMGDRLRTPVTLSAGYWLGCVPVTQGQWRAVVAQNPSRFAEAGTALPVESVSWFEAVEFCQTLTENERTAGRLPEGYHYTLPTEAQWEHACKAGNEKAGERCWSRANSWHQTHPVGQFEANTLGLHDMLGNVSEWCLDWAAPFPGRAMTDPSGPSEGIRRVHRGGSWTEAAEQCRPTARGDAVPETRQACVGFRLALSRAPASEPEPGADRNEARQASAETDPNHTGPHEQAGSQPVQAEPQNSDRTQESSAQALLWLALAGLITVLCLLGAIAS